MPWAVEFYEDEAGGRPVEKFLEQLPKERLGKVLQVLQMLEERGPHLPFPYSSQVEGRRENCESTTVAPCTVFSITVTRGGRLCSFTLSRSEPRRCRQRKSRSR